MSTDQQLKPPASPNPPPPANRLDLSVTKIVGGALAAMTAAALGSRLGVGGTVVGAALASIIAAVATSLYTASLARTQERVKTVFTGRAAGTDVPTMVEVVEDHDTRASTAAPAQPSAPELEGHWRLPTTGTSTVKPARKLNWKSVVIAALATFAIAAATLTTFELVSGHALSGGDGTTITQVGSGTMETRTETPTSKPTPSATSESPEPSSSATDEPTQEPSTAPEPSSQPSTSATSVPTPSASQAPSASSSAADPVPSSGASGGAGLGKGE